MIRIYIEYKPTTKHYISIKIKITLPESLDKSPHRLKKEFPPYQLTKPYIINQKKYTKKL